MSGPCYREGFPGLFRGFGTPTGALGFPVQGLVRALFYGDFPGFRAWLGQGWRLGRDRAGDWEGISGSLGSLSEIGFMEGSFGGRS